MKRVQKRERLMYDEEARDEAERVDEENGGHERASASNVAVRLRPGSADGDVVSIGDDELNACLGRHPVCDGGGRSSKNAGGARVDRLNDRAGAHAPVNLKVRSPARSGCAGLG